MPTYSRESPSPRYRELERLYREVHENGLPDEGIKAADLFAGKSLYAHLTHVRDLAQRNQARTILDYGSGKGLLYTQRDLILANGERIETVSEYWGVDEVRCFDPGVPHFAALPRESFDGVVCTDVLEHVPEEDIPWLLAELFRLADRFVYANIASFPAVKTLPNGWNAHVTVRSPAWWRDRVNAAAKGWRGRDFEFHIRERSRVPGFVRKLAQLPKWKETAISHAGSGGSLPV